MVAPVILVEASPRGADGVAVPVRLAGAGALQPYHYGGQHYRAGITGLPRSIASLDFDGTQLGGGGTAQALQFNWAPATRAALADLAALFWDDAPITVRIGPEGALPPVTSTGLVLSSAVADGALSIALADKAVDLKRPLLVDHYAGTGGIEGPAEFEGQIKSRAWGRCFNLPGKVIDTANNIWVFGDPRRAWGSFDEVRDMGVAPAAAAVVRLGWQGSPEATFAALQAAAAPAGGGVYAASIACVKWWTAPAGDLHADIRGETAGGYVETAPEIAARIVAARSDIPFAAGAVADAAAARPAPFGWRVDNDTTTAAETLSDLLAGVSLSWVLVDDAIVFRRWEWGAPVRVARSHKVTRKSTVKPVGSRKLGYRRNWAPMGRGDLAAIVLARDVVYEDGTPLTTAIENAGKTSTWSGTVDDNGKKPADSATNSADPNSPFGKGKVLDALQMMAKVPAIEETVGAIGQVQVRQDAALVGLVDVVADQDAVQRQATRDVGRLEESLLRALMESARTREVLRDAGIVVDPTDGKVRIFAIDQLKDRTSTAELAIDAVKGVISTKASVDQVQELIALAVLDPSQVAELEPLIRRLTQAESEIDGLNATVALKADLVELTRLSGTVSSVSQTLDAVRGEVDTKAERTVVDQFGIQLGQVEQRLSSLPDTSGYSITVRQARGVADGAADATLRSLLAGDAASRYQISQIAEARQEVTAKMVDGFTAAAIARTAIVAQIGAVRALALDEASASVGRDDALSKRINAQGVTSDDQAAAIGELRQASITAAGGLAGITTTIRQQAGGADETGEALLRALVAGDQTGRARASQLVQLQTEFTTTLVANELASAIARQALLARMGANEAAIVTTTKALADTKQALTQRQDAFEVALNDPATGLPATRARLNTLVEAVARDNAAFSHSLEVLNASLLDPTTGRPVTGAMVAADRKAQVDGDKALAQSIQIVSTTQGEHTDEISFLLRSIAGQEALAQLTLNVDNRITGFVVDGIARVFAIAADRFIVGNSQIFEVDAITGDTVVNSLKAGVVTAREIAAGAVMRTAFAMTEADITIAYG